MMSSSFEEDMIKLDERCFKRKIKTYEMRRGDGVGGSEEEKLQDLT